MASEVGLEGYDPFSADVEDRGAAMLFPLARDKARQFPRYYFRALATATIYPAPHESGQQPQQCFVLTRDLSRGGISVLHPRPLAIGQRLELVFEDGKELSLRVLWCRALDRRCFLMGCCFVKSEGAGNSTDSAPTRASQSSAANSSY
jgi:hypothetical protein